MITEKWMSDQGCLIWWFGQGGNTFGWTCSFASVLNTDFHDLHYSKSQTDSPFYLSLSLSASPRSSERWIPWPTPVPVPSTRRPFIIGDKGYARGPTMVVSARFWPSKTMPEAGLMSEGRAMHNLLSWPSFRAAASAPSPIFLPYNETISYRGILTLLRSLSLSLRFSCVYVFRINRTTN